MIGFAEWLRIHETTVAGIIEPLMIAQIAASGPNPNSGKIVNDLIKDKTVTDFQQKSKGTPEGITMLDPKALEDLAKKKIADSKKKSPGTVGAVGAAGTVGAAAK